MYPTKEVRDMIVRDFPDFVRLNTMRQAKGLPRLKWCEYTDLKNSPQKHAEALREVACRPKAGTLVDDPPVCKASVGPLGGNEQDDSVLTLTSDMEVYEFSPVDGSGFIHQEYEV